MADLTPQEQGHVRVALKFLRTRSGGWDALAKVLNFQSGTVAKVAGGRSTASPTMAFRVARLAGVTVDDLLAGKYPLPGTCPHCGHRSDP